MADELENQPIGQALVRDGAVVEIVRTTRALAGYLPVYHVMPPDWDPELQTATGEWIDTVLADRVERRPDWIFYPTELVVERLQQQKTKQVRRLQIEKMQAVLPGIRDVETAETAELVLEIMRSILPAALSLSAKMARVRDTVQAANAAVTYLRSETDIPTLRAYDPRTAPTWPE